MEEPKLVEKEHETGLSKTLIREANIVLASLKGKPSYSSKLDAYETCLKITRCIDNSVPQSKYDVDFIINTIKTVWDKGILSPLTLNDDEFDGDENTQVRHNKRYHYIYKFDNVIFNDMAFNAVVKREYDVENNCEIDSKPYIIDHNTIVHITRGGVTTGEYFSSCVIRQNIVNRHEFSIQSIVKIPVSALLLPNSTIYVMDEREPKFKVLQEFYDIKINKYDDFKGKYDIRKFKKLKNELRS